MYLNELKAGESAVIRAVNGKDALRQRLLDMGLTPHTLVSVRKTAPLGDPIQIVLRGFDMTLRKEDAAHIEVEERAEAV
jgi:Fe2+ transport system protein FeoA